MQITVKLYASFRAGRFVSAAREVAPGATVLDVLAELNIAIKDVGIIMIDGRHGTLDRCLPEGARLSLFPLLGGG